MSQLLSAPRPLHVWIPRLILATAALHMTVAFTASPSWGAIVRGGVWGTVRNDDYPAMTTLWFTLAGLGLIGIGLLARSSVVAAGRVQREMGPILLAIAVPMSIMEPISGGWLVIAVGLLATWVARQPATASRS